MTQEAIMQTNPRDIMKRALEAAFVTAKIQEAAGSSEIRRVAETPPDLAGNRQQRRANARKARP